MQAHAFELTATNGPTKADVKIKKFGFSGNDYRAYVKGRIAGRAIVWSIEGVLSIFESVVNQEFRRQGVATELYRFIEADRGENLTPSTKAPMGSLSDDAFRFWASFRPSAVADDLRHFTDSLLGQEAVSRQRGAVIIESVGSQVVTGRYKDKLDTTTNLFIPDLVAQGLLPMECEPYRSCLQSLAIPLG